MTQTYTNISIEALEQLSQERNRSHRRIIVSAYDLSEFGGGDAWIVAHQSEPLARKTDLDVLSRVLEHVDPSSDEYDHEDPVAVVHVGDALEGIIDIEFDPIQTVITPAGNEVSVQPCTNCGADLIEPAEEGVFTVKSGVCPNCYSSIEDTQGPKVVRALSELATGDLLP